MKDEHTTHGESSFGKKLCCVIIALFLGGIGWQMWKLSAYNNAVREAREAGFDWKCDDALSLIRQDWHNALKKETWGKHERVLVMGEIPNLGRYREMLHQLCPTELTAHRCENVDGLEGLTGLKELDLSYCPALQNVDALKSLTSLHTLNLYGCQELQNVDALKGLTSLQWLNFIGCRALQNVDGLKGLTALKEICLTNCRALQNLNGLKNLTALQYLDLRSCDKIPAAALRELRTALPKTVITFPDGTKNPPQ